MRLKRNKNDKKIKAIFKNKNRKIKSHWRNSATAMLNHRSLHNTTAYQTAIWLKE